MKTIIAILMLLFFIIAAKAQTPAAKPDSIKNATDTVTYAIEIPIAPELQDRMTILNSDEKALNDQFQQQVQFLQTRMNEIISIIYATKKIDRNNIAAVNRHSDKLLLRLKKKPLK